MEQQMIRIAQALEKVEAINNDYEANKQQYHQLRQELAADIAKALLQRPTIQNKIDSQLLAQQVLPKLLENLPKNDDLKATTNELKATGQQIVNQVRQIGQQLPNSIPITGNFYGFTSWKPFAAYSSVLLLCGSLCTYFWYQKQETVIYKQALQVAIERDFYHNQINEYKNRNPKYANLFPNYDDRGFWSQPENQAQNQTTQP
jgi:hypothetical protein